MSRFIHAFLCLLIILTLSCGFEESSTEPAGSGSAPAVPTEPAGSASVPAAPIEVTATIGNKQVTLQWKENAEASSYNLYWSNAQGVSPATGIKIVNVQSPHMHTGLTNGATYYYVVTAVNGYGESVKSVEVAITLNNAPSIPTEVAATSGKGQAVIIWNPVDKATSYNLYWSQTRGVSQAKRTKIANVSSPYVHTGLTNGASYYYVVTAVNLYGESGNSIEVAITLDNAPPAPTGVAVTSGEGQVRISWNPVEKATTYIIYCSNQPNVQISGSTKINDVTSPYSHKGLSNGFPYYYVVTAANPYGESKLSQEVSTIPRTDLGNARLRVVWIQDMGEGRDVFAQGGNLRLMGLDMGDGQGERVILGTTGSYAKPLITPRGDRVVYTDRLRKKVYVVNWNGSGLRELFGGVGLALWRDPRDGREWIYYGSEEGTNGDEHCPAVYRTLLDSPGTGELVWNRTRVSVHSFQLSADGRMAGGLFPWPIGGVAELPNRSLTKLGSGCWTALAPGNNYAFWVFDSPHRNLYIDDISGEQGRWVNINGAPGINGYEVYHPRWSNHPRVMAMTGPYKMGAGANRIAGGGREVEIHIGRFNTNYTAIESWWRVTNNDRGDFFPDVWISP